MMKPDVEIKNVCGGAINHYSTIRFILNIILTCIYYKVIMYLKYGKITRNSDG
jgi:heme/copper-type cytochrome/quinol oxidase subunit 4